MAGRVLVSCHWLRDALANKLRHDVRVLETAWAANEVARNSFLQEHIPTARFLDLSKHTTPTPSVPRPLPDLHKFCSELEVAGVSDSSHVIIYDKWATTFSARLYMQCKHIGLENVSVLDGGFKHWKHMENDVETGEEAPIERGTCTPNVTHRFIDLQQMTDIIRNQSTQIVDVRARRSYEGKNEEPSGSTKAALTSVGFEPPAPGTMHKGHYKGAKNVHHEELINEDSNCFQKSYILQNMYNEHGVNTQRPTVSACYNGMAACLTALAFAHSEANPENVQVYLGSWTEFGQDGDKQDVEQS